MGEWMVLGSSVVRQPRVLVVLSVKKAVSAVTPWHQGVLGVGMVVLTVLCIHTLIMKNVNHSQPLVPEWME